MDGCIKTHHYPKAPKPQTTHVKHKESSRARATTSSSHRTSKQNAGCGVCSALWRCDGFDPRRPGVCRHRRSQPANQRPRSGSRWGLLHQVGEHTQQEGSCRSRTLCYLVVVLPALFISPPSCLSSCSSSSTRVLFFQWHVNHTRHGHKNNTPPQHQRTTRPNAPALHCAPPL